MKINDWLFITESSDFFPPTHWPIAAALYVQRGFPWPPGYVLLRSNVNGCSALLLLVPCCVCKNLLFLKLDSAHRPQVPVEYPTSIWCNHATRLLYFRLSIWRHLAVLSLKNRCSYLSEMPSVQKTRCPLSALWFFVPHLGDAGWAVPERPMDGVWPSPLYDPEPSADSARTPAIGTCRTPHNGMPAHLCVWLLCVDREHWIELLREQIGKSAAWTTTCNKSYLLITLQVN